jgi:hypothetical protein
MIRYINVGECILVKYKWSDCDSYGEADVQQSTQSLAEALKGRLDDNTSQVILLDTATLKAEDLTEEAAKVWLEGIDANPDEDFFPDFVLNSDVFEVWAELQRNLDKFNARSEYGTIHVANGKIVG